MSRLILVAGPGGSGVSAHAAATVSALRDEGLSVRAVDASGSLMPDDASAGAVAQAVGSVFAEVGADPLAREAWSGLPGLSILSALLSAERALDEADAVVLDAGTHVRAREILQLPGVLVRLLDAALTPRMAMWRSSGGEATAFDALSSARLDALRLRSVLERSSTTLRLVSRPTREGAERALRMMAISSLLGTGVDGIVMSRFPRKSDGASRGDRDDARKALDWLEDHADGVAVWRSTHAPRAVPKGRSAMGPLGRVHVLDAEQLTVAVGDEELDLALPVGESARGAVRVGVSGECLVLALDDVNRWIELPPVLRRCTPVQAVRTGTGLRIVFTPDPTRWRRPGVASLAVTGRRRGGTPAATILGSLWTQSRPRAVPRQRSLRPMRQAAGAWGTGRRCSPVRRAWSTGRRRP